MVRKGRTSGGDTDRGPVENCNTMRCVGYSDYQRQNNPCDQQGAQEAQEVIPMYIPPFVAGVLATLGVEMALLIVCAMIHCGNNDDE